jgi:hypothetical protein
MQMPGSAYARNITRTMQLEGFHQKLVQSDQTLV